ncbi:MAG: LPS translocon maturation chaperone LptM [Pseudomonadota bacterium]
MRAWRTVSVGLVLISVLAGCGQKGPLYREAPEQTAGDAVQQSRSSDQERRQDDSSAVR